MNLTSAQVHFNPLKHHLGFICHELIHMAEVTSDVKKSMFDDVKSVNSNFVDVYTGEYTSIEIQEMIAKDLIGRNIKNETDFQHWLGVKGYRLITLSDKSMWVLRKSIFKSAYVHINPSRIPPLTFRIHGNAWKTVVGLLIIHPEFIHNVPSFGEINSFRNEYMDLSPVKGNKNLQRVMKVYELIRSYILYLS